MAEMPQSSCFGRNNCGKQIRIVALWANLLQKHRKQMDMKVPPTDETPFL